MRSRPTWVVGGALGLLMAVAVADAFRGDGGMTSTQPTATERRGSGPGARAFAGLSGVLYYTDADCILHAVTVGPFRPAPAASWSGCDFSLSPGGGQAALEGTDWAPDGFTSATWDGKRITIASTATNALTFGGSVPRFLPSGRLALVRGGEVRILTPDCLRGFDNERPAVHVSLVNRCSEVTLSRAVLRRAALRHPSAPDVPGYLRSVRVKDMAWFSSIQAGVILDIDFRFVGRFDMLAFFESGRIIETVSGLGERFSGLETSPLLEFVGVRVQDPDGVRVFDASGQAFSLPSLTEPHAFAWSPDGRQLAIATRASIHFVEIGQENPRSERVEIVASDLAWR